MLYMNGENINEFMKLKSRKQVKESKKKQTNQKTEDKSHELCYYGYRAGLS